MFVDKHTKPKLSKTKNQTKNQFRTELFLCEYWTKKVAYYFGFYFHRVNILHELSQIKLCIIVGF